jgi:hypothetical protein
MVWAVRNPRRFWLGMGAALVLAALQLFSNEYLVGLELVRPFFLWLALATVVPQVKPRLVRTLVDWVPFLLVLGVYLLWRVFVIRFPTYQPALLTEIRHAPLKSLLGLAGSALHSFEVVMVEAWGNILQVTFPHSRFAFLFVFMVILSLIGLLLYQNRLQGKASYAAGDDRSRRYVGQFIVIGLVAILVAGIPYYLTGLAVQAHFEFDRLSMSYLLGACLLLAGIVELPRYERQSVMLAAGLASLAIGFQLYNSELFRSETDLQKAFAWQLVWRMPQLKPGTLLLYDDPTFPYTDDEGLTYMVDWTYAPQNHTSHLSVAIDMLSARLGAGIPSLQKGQPIYQDYYLGADFRSSTDQAVVLSFAPPSCLRVLNPTYDQGLLFLPIFKIRNGTVLRVNAHVPPALTSSALPLSNMDQILPAPDRSAVPPQFVFGSEPPHTWCYFFEKADLARQSGDWQKIAQLGDAAFSSSYSPTDLSEYMVFIEAYARLGRWGDAEKLAHLVSDPAPAVDPMLCAIWDRTERAAGARPELAGLKQEFACPAGP